MKQISNLVVVNQEEVNTVKSIMKIKMFGGVITARQDGWVKVMMATGGSSVISVVKSTIFSVLALIMQKTSITILILKTRCFFAKNVNKSLADAYIFCEVISCEVVKILANFVLKYMQRKLSYNFIASLISLVKRVFSK